MWAPEGILGETSSRQLAMWPNKCGPTDRLGTVTGMNAVAALAQGPAWCRHGKMLES